MKNKFRYNAFISYRHNDLDKFVAENLHQMLETYVIPKDVVEKYNLTSNRIERVFRDQEELPLASSLEDSIYEALESSEFLIVICSPRLKDSLWCQKEIETFIKLHGRKNIICVLVEGEPSESFPEAALYEEVKHNGKITKKMVEPLAADVRGVNKSDVKKKLKSELLRVVATMKNVYYDDLKQRHALREQKRKNIIIASVIGLLSIFTIYSAVMYGIIAHESSIIKNKQSAILAKEALEYLKFDDRKSAINTAKEALNLDESNTDAQYALTESLGVYNIDSYKAQFQFDTLGIVNSIKVNDDGEYLLSYDSSNILNLYNLQERKVISSYSDIIESSLNNYSYTFINNDKFAYITKDSIKIYNLKNELVTEIKKNGVYAINASKNGEYLVLNTLDNIELYDLHDNHSFYSYKNSNGNQLVKEMYFNEKYLLFAESSVLNKSNKLVIYTYNIGNDELAKIEIDSMYIKDAVFKGNYAYILTNSGELNNVHSVLVALDLKNNKILWKSKMNDTWGHSIQRSVKEGTNSILVGTSSNAYMYNIKNGELIHDISIGESVIKVFASVNSDMYLIFSETGKVDYIMAESGDVINYVGKYQLNLKYDSISISNYGYIAVPKNENRIVIYDLFDRNIKDVKYKQKKYDELGYKEKEKIKDSYKLIKKNLVKDITISKDKKYIFISYSDDTLEVYNDKKELINSITGIEEGMKYYIGEDKYHNIYLSGFSYSYVLDSSFNKIARVHNLCGITKDKVVIKNYDNYYEVPIYTIKELLKVKE